MLDAIRLFMLAHEGLLTWGSFWVLLSSGLTQMLRIQPIAAWEAAAETYPRFAAFAKLLRAVGFDPVTGLESLVRLVLGKAKRLPPTLPLFIAWYALILSATYVAASLVMIGCVSPAVVKSGAYTLACVVDDEAKNVAPKQIALDCLVPGGEQAVIDMLATMDHRTAAKFPSCVVKP